MLAYNTSSSHNESGAVLTKLASERPHASYEFQDPSNTNFIWQACVKWWVRARLNCMLCKIRCGIYEYASNNTKVRRTKLLPNKNTLTRTLHSNPDLSFYSRLESVIFRLGPSRISFAIKHSSVFNKFSSKNNLHKWRRQFQLDAERVWNLAIKLNQNKLPSSISLFVNLGNCITSKMERCCFFSKRTMKIFQIPKWPNLCLELHNNVELESSKTEQP